MSVEKNVMENGLTVYGKRKVVTRTISIRRDQKELLKNLYQFVINNLSYEEYHNFGSPDNFHKWVEMHYKIIPKSELIINKKYNGNCRNASEAVWNGEKFIYKRHKFGTDYIEEINHYEDDDEYDVFVPIEEINNEI